jgi:hypothetical protein
VAAANGHERTDATVLSRPLCLYPQYLRYKGTAALTNASSFVCTHPCPSRAFGAGLPGGRTNFGRMRAPLANGKRPGWRTF